MDRRITLVIRQLQVRKLHLARNSQNKDRQTDLLKDLSLDELAALVNLSASRLRAVFKAETGLTIAQYAKRVKMQWAQELVRETYLRVAEIAARLEFNDPSHFVREFKRTFGLPPNAYRKAICLSQEQPPQSMNSHPVS